MSEYKKVHPGNSAIFWFAKEGTGYMSCGQRGANKEFIHCHVCLAILCCYG